MGLDVIDGGEIDDDLGLGGECPGMADQRVQRLLVRLGEVPGGHQVHSSTVRVGADEDGELKVHGQGLLRHEGMRPAP